MSKKPLAVAPVPVPLVRVTFQVPLGSTEEPKKVDR